MQIYDVLHILIQEKEKLSRKYLNDKTNLAYFLDDRYLSSEDSTFVENVEEEIEEFKCSGTALDRVLLFPPVNNFRRLLIHRTVENYPGLHSFSVGEGENRRTVVCWVLSVKSSGIESAERSSSVYQPPMMRGRGRARQRNNNSPSMIQDPGGLQAETSPDRLPDNAFEKIPNINESFVPASNKHAGKPSKPAANYSSYGANELPPKLTSNRHTPNNRHTHEQSGRWGHDDRFEEIPRISQSFVRAGTECLRTPLLKSAVEDSSQYHREEASDRWKHDMYDPSEGRIPSLSHSFVPAQSAPPRNDNIAVSKSLLSDPDRGSDNSSPNMNLDKPRQRDRPRGKNKRPDMQVYVPRARRSQETSMNASPSSVDRSSRHTLNTPSNTRTPKATSQSHHTHHQNDDTPHSKPTLSVRQTDTRTNKKQKVLDRRKSQEEASVDLEITETDLALQNIADKSTNVFQNSAAKSDIVVQNSATDNDIVIQKSATKSDIVVQKSATKSDNMSPNVGAANVGADSEESSVRTERALNVVQDAEVTTECNLMETDSNISSNEVLEADSSPMMISTDFIVSDEKSDVSDKSSLDIPSHSSINEPSLDGMSEEIICDDGENQNVPSSTITCKDNSSMYNEVENKSTLKPPQESIQPDMVTSVIVFDKNKEEINQGTEAVSISVDNDMLVCESTKGDSDMVVNVEETSEIGKEFGVQNTENETAMISNEEQGNVQSINNKNSMEIDDVKPEKRYNDKTDNQTHITESEVNADDNSVHVPDNCDNTNEVLNKKTEILESSRYSDTGILPESAQSVSDETTDISTDVLPVESEQSVPDTEPVISNVNATEPSDQPADLVTSIDQNDDAADIQIDIASNHEQPKETPDIVEIAETNMIEESLDNVTTEDINVTTDKADDMKDIQDTTADEIKKKSSKEVAIVVNSKDENHQQGVDNQEPEVEEGEIDEEEDTWDSMFNEDGDCLDPSAMEELTKTVGKVKIQKTKKINYLDNKPVDKGEGDFSAYGHIIEIYDFPAEFVTRDLITAFQSFLNRGFDLKWVDDTHALGIFSSAIAAQDAICLSHPLIKVRPLSQASQPSRIKAKRCAEFLQPYKPRPETSASAARRLVAGALGIATNISKEKRERERQQLKEAKEKRRKDRKNRDDIWEYGKCAMDEET